MKFGVFYKWLLSLVLTLGVVIVLILAVVNWSFQRGFVSYAHQIEIRQAETIASRVEQEYQQKGGWTFLRDDDHQWARLLESSGIPVPPEMAKQPPAPKRALPEELRPPPFEPDLASASVPLALRVVLTDASREPIAGPLIPIKENYWFPIHNGAEIVGWLGLKPIELVSDQLAHSFIAQQRASYVWISLAGLLLALLVASVWARWFLRPIHEVMKGARQLASGHYETSVPVHGNSELGELAQNFNQLARTLARNEQLKRQWIVDISHELRTPIAIIGGEVEAILDGIRQPTQERMEALHTEIGALGKLVDDLHQLSLADQASLELNPTTVDLSALVKEQLEHFQPRMSQQRLSLILDTGTDQHFGLQADARRLSQLVGNLLENSLRYTDTQGEIRIRLRATDDYIVLEVQDSPPGVPEDEMNKIFDRLYRVDRSRSRAHGGSGLGLAICREIVLAHGGKIHAEKSPLGGLAIGVQLPRKNQSG